MNENIRELIIVSLIEECSELQKALTRLLRYRKGDKSLVDNGQLIGDIIEEISDVSNMIDKYIKEFNITIDEIYKIKEFKIKRYNNRVNK